MFLRAQEAGLQISRRNGPSAGAEHRGRLGLEGNHRGLRLPLQPTTSNSGTLLTFAHRPNFKLRVSGRHRAVGTGLFPTTVA
jgi:hypothetical protein